MATKASQSNRIRKKLIAEGKIDENTSYTEERRAIAAEKAKRNTKPDAKELIASAPEGCARLVEYSNINGVRGKRYNFEKAQIYLKAHFETVEDKYRNGLAVMNRNSLTAPEKKILEGLVLYQMVQLGMSRKNIIDYMESEWNVDRSAAGAMVGYVLNQLVETNEKDKERGRAVYLERLENLYANCIERNDIQNALKVMEQMAKARGFFNDTTVLAPVMNFKFGSEPETINLPSSAVSEVIPPSEEVQEELKFEIDGT